MIDHRQHSPHLTRPQVQCPQRAPSTKYYAAKLFKLFFFGNNLYQTSMVGGIVVYGIPVDILLLESVVTDSKVIKKPKNYGSQILHIFL